MSKSFLSIPAYNHLTAAIAVGCGKLSGPRNLDITSMVTYVCYLVAPPTMSKLFVAASSNHTNVSFLKINSLPCTISFTAPDW